MFARTTIAVTALLLGAGLVGPAYAQSQSTPNANQIVKSLTPTPGVNESGTRGIRLVNPGTATPAAPTAPQKAPSVSLNIDFATGSATLTPQARQALDQLGKALSSTTLATYRFRVEGHTDTVGSPAFNKTLSEQRADAVVQYLSSKFQIDPSRLQAVGMGENGLLVQTPPQTPEARNRRVLVVNEGSSSG